MFNPFKKKSPFLPNLAEIEKIAPEGFDLNEVTVRVTELKDTAHAPFHATEGSCGFDLSAVGQTEIKPGEIAYIPTGLRFKIPDGYALFIALRSSSPKKYGIISPGGFGLVDTDYCGPEDEVHVIVQNYRSERIVIDDGARIAQGILVKVAKVRFLGEALADIAEKSRGGFGSTGN